MGKNVAVFVDVANVFYAAKAAGVDIDYVTLLKAASAGRDLVRAYAYTGLDPDNENQRNFHEFLRRHGYKVISKDIRKYGDGKVKANLDIELVVDMMKTARNLDVAIVVSGDGDFAPAIRAVQEMGVRVEVISFRGNTSSDLIEVADLFTEIANIAKVEKGSSRSGRRVADDESDLSMTEVPDKLSEGTGARGRGRGRTRTRAPEGEAVVAAPRARGRGRAAAPVEAAAPVASSGLVVLPGEKLSKVAQAPAAPEVTQPTEELEEEGLEVEAAPPVAPEGDAEEHRRRRRRRGGRGRGRGRGTEEGVASTEPEAGVEAEEEAAAEPTGAPKAPARRAAAFGSVWDSQIGIPAASAGTPRPIPDEEDLDEPPIPEYLIAERRQRDARGSDRSVGRGRGGARGAYAAAVDRERFGGGRSGGVSRFAEPAPRGGRDLGGPRFERGPRPAADRVPRPAPRTGSPDEPWSEVPPELEAMLRAQLGARPAAPGGGGSRASMGRSERPPRAGSHIEAAPASPTSPVRPAAEVAPVAAATPPRRRTRATIKEAAPAALESAVEIAPATAPAARRRTTRAPKAVTEAPVVESSTADAPAAHAAETEKPKRRVTRRKAEPAD